MGLFDFIKNSGNISDVIRCDEQSYLIWKWHPTGSQKGNNSRENAIRWGSSLRVKDGEVAVFVYKQPNNNIQEYIVGPCDQIIETSNLPIISNIVGLAYGGGTPFQAEVYFINLAQIIQVRFAVPFFDVYDPRFSDFGVPVAARGTISFTIKDFEEFIKLHRLIDFNLNDFQKEIKDAVSRYAKDTIANAPAVHNIPVIQIESKIAQINDIIEFEIKERFSETFGIYVSAVDLSSIEIDKGSGDYARLMQITRDVVTAKTQFDTLNYEETLRIQREEGQYSMHKQTQTANLGAFQVEKQAEVGVSGAEALGKMGSNGAGNVSLGSGDSSGFNPANMMVGMTLGSALGQNIAGTMNSVLSGTGNQLVNSTPPPIPTIAYHVVINGKATGPYDIETLKQMILTNQFNGNSLVWTQGMSNWCNANTVDVLKNLFTDVMPSIPNQ